MFYNKEQKSYFYIAMTAALVLIVVTVWNPSSFKFKDNTDYEKLAAERSKAEKDQYEQYLASLKTDSEASKRLLSQLVTEESLRKEVELTLQINQKIATPDIPDSTLVILQDSNQQAVLDYFKQSLSATLAYNQAAEGSTQNLFVPNISPVAIQTMQAQNNDLIRNLRGIPVPKEALAYHKSQILAYEHYGNVLTSAQSFASGNQTIAWPDIYRNYVVINDEIETANAQFGQLETKYKISGELQSFFAQSSASSLYVHSAEAFIIPGIGEIVIADIPAAIWKAIREALARAFARFAISMLDKVVTSIESNFAITSQLYYSEALGQVYTTEYLQKHVTDPLDQEIIKRFIPQYFCLPKDPQELRQIFSQKSRDYLGYDPATLDPTDPDFYNKLARSGSFFASPDGQELYYEQLAAQAASAAADASSKEVVSPGLKTPRSLVNNQIERTMATIFNTQQAAISGTIQLGTNNTENVVGQLVSAVIENLINKFVFTGAVIQEQKTCVGSPTPKPIIPAEASDYQYTPPSENPDDYIDPIFTTPATSVQTPVFR
jgi:hypothetical protein